MAGSFNEASTSRALSHPGLVLFWCYTGDSPHGGCWWISALLLLYLLMLLDSEDWLLFTMWGLLWRYISDCYIFHNTRAWRGGFIDPATQQHCSGSHSAKNTEQHCGAFKSSRKKDWLWLLLYLWINADVWIMSFAGLLFKHHLSVCMCWSSGHFFRRHPCDRRDVHCFWKHESWFTVSGAVWFISPHGFVFKSKQKSQFFEERHPSIVIVLNCEVSISSQSQLTPYVFS